MFCALGRWFSLRDRRFLAWILLGCLLPLPVLLELSHSCRLGINRSAPSVLVAGRKDGGGDSPRLWDACLACKLLRNLLTDGRADSPAMAAAAVGRLSFPPAGLPIPWLHPETSLLPRPPPAHRPGQRA